MTKEEQKNTGSWLTSNALINEEIALFGSSSTCRLASGYPSLIPRHWRKTKTEEHWSINIYPLHVPFIFQPWASIAVFGGGESHYITTMWVQVCHTRSEKTGLHVWANYIAVLFFFLHNTKVAAKWELTESTPCSTSNPSINPNLIL